MESPSDPHSPYPHWFSKRTAVIVLAGLGLLLLVFQVNKMLTSSFRIEIFGVEILEVQHLDEEITVEAEATAQEERYVVRRIPPAPVPELPPMPEAPPIPTVPPISEMPADPEAPPVPAHPADHVYVVVEQMPALIGGLREIQRQIKYPEIAKRAGIQGRVIIQFIVDQQGQVTETKIVRGVGGGCDEEAMRVVKQARFRPGKHRGQPVKVKMSLPVTFKLQ